MTEPANSRTASLAPVALLWEKTGMLVVFAVLFAVCALFVEDFFSWVNVKGLALAVSQIGMVGCTMLFCLASGDFDLSVNGYWGASVDGTKIGSAAQTGVIRVRR